MLIVRRDALGVTDPELGFWHHTHAGHLRTYIPFLCKIQTLLIG